MLGLAAGPAQAGPSTSVDIQYVSGPGGAFAGWTQPVLVMRAGDTVTYTNVDIAPHDVVATVVGPDEPWCTTKPFNYAPGTCPLFATPLITLGRSTAVLGLNNVQPEGQYPFICRLHPNMKGTLVVLPQ